MPHVELRAFTAADIPAVTGLASDARVTALIGDGRPWSSATVDARASDALADDPLDRIGSSRWYVAAEDERTVGLGTATRRDDCVEIGYWVDPADWGRGIAGAIVTELVHETPAAFGTERLVARVHPSNEASARALRRRGFTVEGARDGVVRYGLDVVAHAFGG